MELQVRACFLLNVLLGHSCYWISEKVSCTSFECIGAHRNHRATFVTCCKNVISIFFLAQLLQRLLRAARVPSKHATPRLSSSQNRGRRSLCLSLVAFVTATSTPFLSPLFSSCTPYLRPTSQPISQVVLATAQSDSSPVHLR